MREPESPPTNEELEFAIALSDARFDELQNERRSLLRMTKQAREFERQCEKLAQEVVWLKRLRAALLAVAITAVVVALGCTILLVRR